MLGYIISDKKEINVDEHEIQSFDVLHKTKLNIYVVENNKVLYQNNILFHASKNGHVKILKWLKNSGYEITYASRKYAILEASINKHIKVLKWFKNLGYEFDYEVVKFSISYASEKGDIKILEWFKNSGFEFRYDEWAINNAAQN